MTTTSNQTLSRPYQQPLIDPDTPSFGLGLSSPDTPSLNLDTPVHSQSSGKRQSVGSVMDIDHPSDEPDDGVGLGYGDVGLQAMDKGKGKGMGRDEAILASGVGSSSETSPILPSSGHDDDPDDEEIISKTFPEEEELRRMAKRLEELQGEANAAGSSGQQSELIGMVQSLLSPTLEHLPFMRRQVEAQRQTILTLQRQARLSEELMKVERERHMVERDGWRSETRAMLKVREDEIASGIRPRKVLELNVGYHQELEAANKRLEMDNRLMAPRLADASQQVDRLVNELRHLRPYVIIETAPTVQPVHPTADPDQPRMYPTESSDRRKSSSPFKRTGQTTMGDARTELLLLAAKKLRNLRGRDDETGLVTLNEMKRGGVIGPDGGIGYVEGYGGLMLEPEDAEDELSDSSEDERPVAPVPRSKGAGATPALPQSKGAKRGTAPPTTPRGKNRRASATTPGGSNFNDLLRAAEMATRPVSPTPRAGPSGSRTNRKRADSIGERATSPKRSRREAPATDWIPRRGTRARNTRRGLRSQSRDDYDDSQEDAGLDLLLQASQMDVQQNPGAATAPLPSASRFEGMIEGPKNPGRSNEQGSSLAPAIDLRAEAGTSVQVNLDDQQIDPSLVDYDVAATPTVPRPSDVAVHTPARRNPPTYLESGGDFYDPEDEEDEDDVLQSARNTNAIELPPGAYASPTGATVPGLGKYVHLTSNVPARRMRSPYLKWTVEEDELLARAVALHGEKWDLVSKGVPTRSYHQVRQRWLRKTGAFDKKHGQEPLGNDDTSPSPGNKGGKKKK